MILLSHPFWQQKGGVSLAILVSFLISVMASVVGYYICKWLDGDDSDN
ncbi:MAG: nitrate reductase [Lachnospiraceae bacterium]|nr:nitrate reductase [Lachnospiraceae bacterium]